MKRILIYILLVLSAAALHAQPLSLIYELKPASNGSEDTLSIALRNNTAATIDLGAVNFSVAFQGACAALSVGSSDFSTDWGASMEFANNQPISLDYEYIIYVNGTAKPSGVINYDQRWQYGNTNAGSATPVPVSLAPGMGGIEVMRVLVNLQATCSGEVYLESISENPANEIADMAGNTIDYDIQRVDDVLPVEWLDFVAYQTGDASITLDWATAIEINNDKFEVEKSLDGMIFGRIGEVKGQGNTSSVTTYDFVDDQVEELVNYYRIKQVDFNGDFSYSNIQEVRMGAGFAYQVEVYPNPAAEYVTVSATADGAKSFELSLVDMAGRVLYFDQVVKIGGSKTEQINVSDLAPGVYMIRLREQSEDTFISQSFIKK